MLALKTDRLRLRVWTENDRDAFAMMNAHSEVMHGYGGPIGRADSDVKFDRYSNAFERHGDFVAHNDLIGDWRGLAWVARPHWQRLVLD